MLKNLLILSSFSVFVVVVIIGLEIYHNYSKSSLTTKTQGRVEDIPDQFDKETLEGLKQRSIINVNLSEQTGIISDRTQEEEQPSIIEEDLVATESGISL